MIISDLNYIESIDQNSVMDVNGGDTIAISQFSVTALGQESFIYTLINNLATSNSAYSSIRITAAASGGNAITIVSASSQTYSGG